MEERNIEIKHLIERVSELIDIEREDLRREIDTLKEELSDLRSQLEEIKKSGIKSRINSEIEATIPESIPDVPIVKEEPKKVIGFSIDTELNSDFEIIDYSSKENRAPILGDLFSNPSRNDRFAKGGFRWETDIPGSKIDDISDAMSLNDRLFFTRELFSGDDEQFMLTIDRINTTTTFKEVLSDMRVAFPEWNEGSDGVYRFYMVVRRKFRD